MASCPVFFRHSEITLAMNFVNCNLNTGCVWSLHLTTCKRDKHRHINKTINKSVFLVLQYMWSGREYDIMFGEGIIMHLGTDDVQKPRQPPVGHWKRIFKAILDVYQ